MKFDALFLHRIANKLYKWKIPLLPRFFDMLIFFFFNTSIHHSTEIGQGTNIAYRGMSVLIHKKAKIGRNVNIGAHVVIGGRSAIDELPIIEDDVDIGSNACIVGNVKVGKGAMIGAGAVVISDVPAGEVVAGVPAKVINSSYKERLCSQE